jgi:hypothetical protein
MSKTNITKHEEYKVNDAWTKEEPTNVEECLKRLVQLSKNGNKLECHGVDQD